MLDAINHLKMAAEDCRRLTTPNQFTITEAAARENERLANQFDLAAEALRQMHNRMFEEGIVAGVKSLVDSCNARRQRKASPASAPEGYGTGRNNNISPTKTVSEDRKDAERWKWITRDGRTRELRIPANENKASIDAAIDGAIIRAKADELENSNG